MHLQCVTGAAMRVMMQTLTHTYLLLLLLQLLLMYLLLQRRPKHKKPVLMLGAGAVPQVAECDDGMYVGVGGTKVTRDTRHDHLLACSCFLHDGVHCVKDAMQRHQHKLAIANAAAEHVGSANGSTKGVTHSV